MKTESIAIAAHAAGLVALFVAWPFTVLFWTISLLALKALTDEEPSR